MGTVTDFKAWVSLVDPDDYEDVYCLYKAINDLTNYGGYKIVSATGGNNRWILSRDNADDNLLIASQFARKALIKYINDSFGDDEMDIEGWYAYKTAMSKDD